MQAERKGVFVSTRYVSSLSKYTAKRCCASVAAFDLSKKAGVLTYITSRAVLFGVDQA